MSEADSIASLTDSPNTVSSLVRDFRSLGLESGMTVLVHSSLSALGWVCGGAPAVILALEEVLGINGTLIMPAHSGDLSDPAFWENPPVPKEWWQTIRDEMPPFERDLTPTRGMGVIAETFRKQDGVARSGHPQSSFAARGRNRDFILQDEHLSYQMNDESPLGRLYELDGFILLLGVGWDNNTSFHLSEYRASWKGKHTIVNHAPVLENGVRVWKEMEDINYGGEDFPGMGAAFEAACIEAAHAGTIDIRSGTIGRATAKLVRQHALVDFSVEWIEKNRNYKSNISTISIISMNKLD